VLSSELPGSWAHPAQTWKNRGMFFLFPMLIIVVVEEDLMESALKVSGLKPKRGVIEEGLKLLVQLKSQKEIRHYRGKLKWSGNLDEMRSDQ
jgi:hypothetical protein